MDVCSLQFYLGKRLNFAEELLGGITEARESIFVCGVYLYNMLVAGSDRYASFHCMLTYVAGHFVYFLTLKTLTVAQADHEVFYDLEILHEFVS